MISQVEEYIKKVQKISDKFLPLTSKNRVALMQIEKQKIEDYEPLLKDLQKAYKMFYLEMKMSEKLTHKSKET